MRPSRDISGLLDIMAKLRTPGSGCPWDLEQNFSTIAPYTIEEAYEVADAIARGDLDDLRDELGDLLLQVVFHARMAEEQNVFAFGDVVELAAETGDLLFALVNLARHVGADPESALRGTNAKFERRFAYIERALAAKGRSIDGASLEEMDALWNEAKSTERPAASASVGVQDGR